jgi:HD-GYP domain-containing protein (c-di-GMP phosphodiesterase class II)
MSVLPVIVLAYLLHQFNSGHAVVDSRVLLMIIVWMGLGVLAGFLSMRQSIIKIQELSQEAKEALVTKIPGINEAQSDESEVTQLRRTFSEVTASLSINIKRLETSKKTLQYVLSKLATGLSSLSSLDTFLDLIVEITANALEAQVGVLMLVDQDKHDLYVKTLSGLPQEYKAVRIAIGDEMPGWVAQHKTPLLMPQPLQIASPQKLPFKPPLLCSPMLFNDKIIGVLGVSGKVSGSYDEDDLLIVSNLASQTAIAVENDRLHADAERTYIETIQALAMAVEARDPYSRGHSERVAKYSMKIAQALKLSQEIVQDIVAAAELHDVGKIGIADDILKKPGPLNEEEWFIMRKHPVIGEGIVKPLTSLSKLCSIIRYHHEWIDGIGYPDALKGDQIPLGAKILAVADSFDAMTSDRPYRKALSINAAIADLRKYIGIRYEKDIVEALIGAL